jgi:hypothetical protein
MYSSNATIYIGNGWLRDLRQVTLDWLYGHTITLPEGDI